MAKTLTGNSADVLNAIRSSASDSYKQIMPVAEYGNLSNLANIRNTIFEYEAVRNSFVSALVNRIAYVIVTSRLYENPLQAFKKGTMEYGFTVEDIFVDLCKPFVYDVEKAEQTVFKREMPDIKSAFYNLNYQTYYKQTIQEQDLQQAFLSWDGVNDLITKIIDKMYTSANYDEFEVMKYLIAKALLNGTMTTIGIPAVEKPNYDDIMTTIRATSNAFTFMSTKYNYAEVSNFSDRSYQYVLVNSQFDAAFDVNSLAYMFNMEKADFIGRKILIDSFGSINEDRLARIIKDYVPLTEEEKQKLEEIPVAMLDANWYQIYDVLQIMKSQENGEGLYWNYWLHVWKIVNNSPFANNAVFVVGEPVIDSITISPAQATVTAGQSVQLADIIATSNFASKKVTWESSNDSVAVVDYKGLVSVSPDAQKGDTVEITVKSDFDTTKTATATITIA